MLGVVSKDLSNRKAPALREVQGNPKTVLFCVLRKEERVFGDSGEGGSAQGRGHQVLGTNHGHRAHLSPSLAVPCSSWASLKGIHRGSRHHMLQLQYLVSFYFCEIQRHMVSKALPGTGHLQPQPRCHPELWD